MLCALYTQVTNKWILNDPSFVAGFPTRLRRLVEGHQTFVDGGYQGLVPFDTSCIALQDVLTL